jgi:hypothetical protein
MNSDVCVELLYSKFPFFNFAIEIRDQLLKCSHYLEEEEEIKRIDDIVKKDTFILNRFYSKSMLYINDLMIKFKSRELEYLPINLTVDQIQVANKEFKLDTDNCKEILLRIFQEKNQISLEDFFLFFNKKRTFNIKIVDFLEISLSHFATLFSQMERKITKMFNFYDTRKQGMMNYKDFDEMMSSFLRHNENKWKINDYFLYFI